MTERCDKCRKRQKNKEAFSLHDAISPKHLLCPRCEIKWQEFHKKHLKGSDPVEKWSEYFEIFLNRDKEKVLFT